MRFTDRLNGVVLFAAAALLLPGCSTVKVLTSVPPTHTPPPLSKPDWLPFPPPAPYPPPAPLAPAVSRAAQGSAVSSMQAYRLRAAARITAVNADATYSGPLPEPLASIPVLQVQLSRDGSVAKIEVLRVPKFEPQTVEMAKAAVMRAAPFGFVGNLPQPWTFNETFLYNDALKFQLRSVVEGE